MTEPAAEEPEAVPDWGVVTRFRRVVLRLSLVLVVAGAGGALLAGTAAAKGVLLGGSASVLGFEIAVRTFGKLSPVGGGGNEVEKHPGNRVKFVPSIWWMVRFLAYVAALVKSYDLDTTQYRGLFGAVAGLFVVRVVVMIVGVTGMDLEKASR